MRSLLTTLATLFVLAPCATIAETYFDLSLSMVMPANETVRGVPRAPGTSGPIELATDSGFGAALAWGLAHEHGRTELELGYHRTRTDSFRTSDGSPLVWEPGNPRNWEASVPAIGDTATTSLMVNHYGTFGEGAARPYLGAGIGIALHSVDLLTARGVLHRGIRDTLSGDTVVFAYQVKAGITYGQFRIGYRWFQSADAEVDNIEFTHGRHAVEMGVRF